MTRFWFVQVYDEYTDYDTNLGAQEDAEALAQYPNESVRRLTFVDRKDGQHSAYLIMRDHSEKRITWNEGLAMLREGGVNGQMPHDPNATDGGKTKQNVPCATWKHVIRTC